MPQPPAGDPDKAEPARVYDALAGGYDNYPADRALAARLEAIYPGVRRMVRRNREFIGGAVMMAAGRHGIRQFLDLGSGFPAAGSVPDLVQARDPDARVACIDWDPTVGDYDAELKNAAVALADLRDHDAVLGSHAVTGLIDLDEPVCVTLGMVLPTMPPAGARDAVAGYVKAVAAGSVVVITMSRNESPALLGRLCEAWTAETGAKPENYTLAEVESLFAGLEVQHPGVGPVVPVAGLKLFAVGGTGVKRLAHPCCAPRLACT